MGRSNIKTSMFGIVAGYIFASFLLLSGIFHYAYQFYIYPVTDQAVKIEIKSGKTFAQISTYLEQKNLLPSLWYWRLHAKLEGLETQIHAGEYLLTDQDTMASVLNKFVTGDAILYQFTLLNGWNLYQTLEAMNNTFGITVTTSDIAEIAAHLNITHEWPEGWFYPDTYSFHLNTDHLKLLSQAHEMMKEKLAAAWDKRAADLPLKSPYEALILASIVEKEAVLENEQKLIAGVYISRLNKNMLLQADPTVIYGIGKLFDGNITRRDLETDTPYNTYIHSGLPPTPIAMPAESTLEAVMNPDITGDLYFVAKGDNSHSFSKTYAEHKKAVAKYQLKGRRLRNAPASDLDEGKKPDL